MTVMIDPIRDFFLYKYMEKYKTIIRLRLLFLSLQTSISNVSGGRLQIPSGEGVWTVLAPDKTKNKKKKTTSGMYAAMNNSPTDS